MVRTVVVVGALLAAPVVAQAQQRCTTDANQVVTRIYQQILERTPDANAAGRVQQLAGGQVTVRQVVADIAKSQEHSQRFLAPTETAAQKANAVNFIYKHLLGRSADPSGLQNYVRKAEQSGFNAVIDEIMASAEYAEWAGDDGVPGTSIRFCGRGAQTNAAPAAAPQAQMRFRGLDANGDGQIARTEWRGSAQSFRVHDWNEDGVLSGEEVKVGGRRAVARGQDRDFGNTWSEQDFTDLDRNRDGRVTAAEWYFDAESFRRADRNRDNVLSRVEFLGTDVADDDREDQFAFLDDNGNGRVERYEWHGSRDAFEWLDRNNDGTLSRAEVVGGNENAAPDGFVNLDADRDGRIQLDEWRWSRRSFNVYDVNGDGAVTRAEFRTGGGVPTTGR